MRPISDRQRDETERQFNEFMQRKAAWWSSELPRVKTDAEKIAERRKGFRLGLLGFAALALAHLAFCSEAKAQVASDKLDQAARCSIYLSFKNPDVDASAMMAAATSNLSEGDSLRVTVRALELLDPMTKLSEPDAERAVREVLRLWRPNCVAVGALGAGQ